MPVEIQRLGFAANLVLRDGGYRTARAERGFLVEASRALQRNQSQLSDHIRLALKVAK